MKRKIATLLVILMVLSITACQATPEEIIVVQKDTERLVEQAKDENIGTEVSEIDLPEERYTYSNTAMEGQLVINVDAPVSLPASGKIPTARVAEKGFTQEQIYAFFNYLFGDEKVYIDTSTGNTPPTKSELEELIVTYKKYIAEGTVEQNTLYTEEELQDEIALLEEELKTAPETVDPSEPLLTDGTLYDSEVSINGAPLPVLHLQGYTENYEKTISVTIPKDENGGWENYFSYTGIEIREWYSEANAIRIDAETAPDAARGKISLPFDEAKSFCEGFFAAGGITDVTLSDAYLVDNERLHGEEDGQFHAADSYAYKFVYVRTVNDTPVCNTSSVTGRGDESALPWTYEGIVIHANDAGYDIEWNAHTHTGEIINEDTGVMTFDEARQVFESMVEVVYGAYEELTLEDSQIRVNVNEVALSLIRVREQNSSGRNGIYTPAWVFSGHTESEVNGFVYYNAGTTDKQAEYPVLVINAIDGSIIDLEKGY